jgi:uncharacterized protein
MTNTQGEWIWYELMTSDPDAAASFYGTLVGWRVKDSGQAGMDYREWWMGDVPIGGLMKMPDGAPMPSCWMGYVAVDDIHAGIEAVKETGGTVHMGPQEVPGVGQFAFVSDPQGAMLYIMQDVSGETSTSFADDKPRLGHCAWNELMTSDPQAALGFYGGQFAWAKDGEMDMGDMGAYHFVKHPRQGVIGAIMANPPGAPVGWAHYFRVASIAKAADAIPGLGGQVINGPMEIPGGDWIVQGIDPQGAFFSLVGGK